METYAFVLGRQPEFSVAEILARLEAIDPLGQAWRVVSMDSEILLVRLGLRQSVVEFFETLGGAVKVVQVRESRSAFPPVEEAVRWIGEQLASEAGDSGRVLFGISLYGRSIPPALGKIAPRVKESLSQRDIASRYVEPSEGKKRHLSSAQVEKTGLLTSGAEIVLVSQGEQLHFGKTLQVQRFEDIARRDYGKPERRIESGLLPPKFARILVNLAGSDEGTRLLDPFCGSGVLLMEGALLGCRMTGVDCSQEAVDASRANLEWLEGQGAKVPPWEVLRSDARQLVGRFGPFAFDAIAGEGDLGPAFHGPVRKKTIQGLVKRLKKLYTTSLSELRSVVRPGGRVVLALPRWVLEEGDSVGLGLGPWIRLMGYRERLVFEACGELAPPEWTRRRLIYHRPGQTTAREVFCLEA